MIPRIIHFVYGLRDDFGGKPFSFVHWAAIRSAIATNPDYRVMFWHQHLPRNDYFDDVEPLMELRRIEAPQQVYGRPLLHVAHQADVVRLNALIEHGGVYLDVDTVTVRSFDPLLENRFVMGWETAAGKTIGMCNAIMLSEKDSAFARKWRESYRSFRSQGRDAYWNEHSVKIPMQLASEAPETITVLPDDAFFQPDWSDEGLERMFHRNERFPSAFAHHLWESKSWGALQQINEFNVDHLQTSYTAILNRHLAQPLRDLADRRRALVAARIAQGGVTLNLGSGARRDLDAVNIDLNPASGADLVFDLAKDPWALPDACATRIVLHHVMEHLDGDLRHFFQELYRVCEDGAIVDIRVPHPRHDHFLIDPTHVRAWHEESFDFLNRRKCLGWYLSGNAKTPLALYWNIDFEVVSRELSDDARVDHRFARLYRKAAKALRLGPYANNLVDEIKVRLRARKPAAEDASMAIAPHAGVQPSETLHTAQRSALFQKVYTRQLWGASQDPTTRFFSGAGSHDPAVVAPYLKSVSGFLASLGRKPDVVDLGCGDFAIGARIRALCGRYIACDLVDDLIRENQRRHARLAVEFRQLDLVEDALPPGEIAFVRQVFQHLSNAEIGQAMRRITSNYRFLVLTEHLPDSPDFVANRDKATNHAIRLNQGSGVVLTREPFCLRPLAERVICDVPAYGGLIRTMLYQLRH